MRKKLLSVALCVAMAATALVGCGSKDDTKDAKKDDNKNNNTSTEGNKDNGSVYFLNFKPEIADAYDELMAAFTKETGVKAKVVTAAENQYESTLKVEMEKEDAPTLFTINGP